MAHGHQLRCFSTGWLLDAVELANHRPVAADAHALLLVNRRLA